MTVADVVERGGATLLTVAGGAFGYSFVDSLPTSTTVMTPSILSIPILSWAGIIALLGVAVEWGRVRENLRATNEKMKALEEGQSRINATLALLTQALAARGVIVVPGSTFIPAKPLGGDTGTAA